MPKIRGEKLWEVWFEVPNASAMTTVWNGHVAIGFCLFWNELVSHTPLKCLTSLKCTDHFMKNTALSSLSLDITLSLIDTVISLFSLVWHMCYRPNPNGSPLFKTMPEDPLNTGPQANKQQNPHGATCTCRICRCWNGKAATGTWTGHTRNNKPGLRGLGIEVAQRPPGKWWLIVDKQKRTTTLKWYVY